MDVPDKFKSFPKLSLGAWNHYTAVLQLRTLAYFVYGLLHHCKLNTAIATTHFLQHFFAAAPSLVWLFGSRTQVDMGGNIHRHHQ